MDQNYKKLPHLRFRGWALAMHYTRVMICEEGLSPSESWWGGMERRAGKAALPPGPERNTDEDLKVFSIFKLRPIPSGSESFKPILEASRSPIFDPDLSSFKKIIFLSATTTFISLKSRKTWFSQGFAYKSGSSWQKNNFFQKWKIRIENRASRGF